MFIRSTSHAELSDDYYTEILWLVDDIDSDVFVDLVSVLLYGA